MMVDSPNKVEKVEAGLTAPYSGSEPLAEDLIAIRDEYDHLSDGEQQKHVYACAGLALYRAQCFEAELTQVILSVKKAKGKLLSPDEYEALDSKLSKKTLGGLIREVRDFVEINDHGEAVIEKALNARNSLTHGFFWRHAENMVTDRGRRKVMDDLLNSVQLFRVAEGVGIVTVRNMLRCMGSSQEEVDQLYEKMVKRLRAEDE